MSWGDIYYRAIRKGYDHGYCAYLADRWEERLKRKERNVMTEVQIKHMVDRFLMWKLPVDFNPDNGVSFSPIYNEHSPCGPQRREPVGTNLLDAQQATAMVRYMIDGLPVSNGDHR